MTKIKATNKDLLDLLHSLYAVQDLKGLQFAIGVSKNIDRLKADLEYVNEASIPTEDFQKLITEVQMIENSNPSEEAGKLIAELENKNQKLIDERKSQLKELDELLKEEAEIELVQIPEKALPSDISAKQLGGIMKLIK